MEKPLTPSQKTPEAMTDGQIDKIVDNVRAGLRKRCNDFKSADVQQALKKGQLDKKIIQATETALEEAMIQVANNTIKRTVKVDRSLTPQQVLDATKRRQYTNSAVVVTMPSSGTGVEENVTVEFFQIGKNISDDKLAKTYKERGLVPDPYAQAAVNEADPAFADKYPNGTHWKDVNGNWCFAAFDRDVGERFVNVYRVDLDWDVSWWFGGVRK